jgi:hypothetical protein
MLPTASMLFILPASRSWGRPKWSSARRLSFGENYYNDWVKFGRPVPHLSWTLGSWYFMYIQLLVTLGVYLENQILTADPAACHLIKYTAPTAPVTVRDTQTRIQ